MVPTALQRSWVAALWVATILFASLAAGCTPSVSPAADPGAVVAEGTLAAPVLLVGDERTVYAKISVRARDVAERAPGPVNIALCVDTSGSMAGEGIVAARRAALAMVAALRDGDRLAVVAFHTKTEVVLPSTEIDDEVKEEVAQKIAELEAMGTTDMAGGLRAAVREVETHYDAERVNRVVLLGDGVPNRPDSIESTARSAQSRGIAISALGLGLDYDEVLMGKVAELSGGRYRYIEKAEQIAAFFDDELTRLSHVHARNVGVSLTAGPGVRIVNVVGSPNPASEGSAYVPLGDLARGETRDVFVRMTVTPRKAKAPVELLDAAITFEDGFGDAGQLERRIYFGALASADEGEVAKARDPAVELAAALAEAGATTIRALELSKQQQYVRSRKLLEEGAEAARAQAKRTPSDKLEKHAVEMLAVAADMPKTDPAPRPAASIDFQSDSLEAPAISPSPLAPPAARRQKELHQEAYQLSH